MQSTPNYLWHTEDVLGQGATACVYKARNKKSGELVAVKVFNNASYLRPQEVQMREFEMLRKLNHKNIVKLFAVEETGTSKQKVLVMEYCSSGSLLNVLEDPANAFGLSESEFLIVLQCVVAGMNHLRENGIVHRDIKPGNIMRLMGEDGQSIYKLTDFGAARELDDDEKFVSVYGTEEYLHPDMYERAVLRKPQQKAYGVTVDLWSIGVTFYHAATGSLPFIPFGGPRRNKEIMHKITTEKPPGAIAGVQRQENGTIEWSYELPATCRLSAGLKVQLIPILANILEADQEKCWGFDQFFAETSDILHRIVVDVFSLQQASSHRVYIHSHNTTTKFLDAVFKQTNIAPHHQEYFFEGHLYELDPNLQAHSFCQTTENNPLTLLSAEPEDLVGVRYRDPALEFPKFFPKVDVVADCGTAKSAVGAAHRTLWIARSLLRCQELVLRGLHWVAGNLKSECSRILEQRRGAVSLLTCLQLTEVKTRVLYETVSGDGGMPALKELSGVKTRLQAVVEDLSQCSHDIFDYQGTLDGILAELVKHRQQAHEDKSIRQIECCLEKMQLIHKQFKKARKCLRLGYNEEQIHKLDKVNLGHLARKVLLIFQDDCVQKYQEVLVLHGSRMRKVCEIKKHLKRLSNCISACSVTMTECQDSLQHALDKFLQTVLPEKRHLAPAPSPAHLNQAHHNMAFRMQELLEQMKSVTCNLQFNNSIIEQLSGAAPAPGI
ncbi:inhibitor of nuclear factor kappa-B kinase subunit epsilon isoform X2 [Apteryx mantelli]|uniref:Inhibitor of nuclear factor kappa-B kinase subunit epsilon isoform X2 n=3 Tax=Apteryx mantelli TaxID=2696672 RepID=A0ABM4FP33_9AVES